jgi:hypothetical protein
MKGLNRPDSWFHGFLIVRSPGAPGRGFDEEGMKAGGWEPVWHEVGGGYHDTGIGGVDREDNRRRH